MTNKILAAGSVALMGAGALAGATPATAVTAADCGTFDGATVTLLDGKICDVVFDVPGEYSFKAPAGVTALEGVMIGAGAGGLGYDDGSTVVGYGGHAGEIAFYDGVSTTTDWIVYVGMGGPAAYSTAYNSVVGNLGESSGLTLDVPGDYPGAQGYEGPDDDGPYNAEGANTGNPDITSGFLLSDPALVGANNPLWPAVSGELEYGVGGSGGPGRDPFGNVTAGSGGNANGDEGQDGGDGMVVLRYLAPGLASTGVDAAPMGIAAVGMLVAGGIGLAIARRARRSN